MNVYDGRPAVETGRLEREIRTYDLLDKLGISYQRTDHEPADHMEACYRIDSVLNVEICKNLFLCNRQKTAFYLLMMPGRNEDVLKDEFFGCHPCVSTSSLKLKTKDLTERFLPATGHPFQTVQLKGKEE